MDQITEFLDKYFFYLWVLTAVSIASTLFFRGRRALQKLGDLNLDDLIYSENNASAYSEKSFFTKWSSASKVLHIIITRKELIFKTYLIFAFIAEKNDLLHRIPFDQIQKTGLKQGTLLSKLFVEFRTPSGELKEIILMSKNNEKIKQLIDEQRKMK